MLASARKDMSLLRQVSTFQQRWAESELGNDDGDGEGEDSGDEEEARRRKEKHRPQPRAPFRRSLYASPCRSARQCAQGGGSAVAAHPRLCFLLCAPVGGAHRRRIRRPCPLRSGGRGPPGVVRRRPRHRPPRRREGAGEGRIGGGEEDREREGEREGHGHGRRERGRGAQRERRRGLRVPRQVEGPRARARRAPAPFPPLFSLRGRLHCAGTPPDPDEWRCDSINTPFRPLC